MSAEEHMKLKVDVDDAGIQEKFKKIAETAEGIGKSLKTLTGLGIFEVLKEGVEGVVEGLEKMKELAEFGAELDNLAKHVPVERLEMMQEATEHTVDKLTLMKFAMKALSGESGLTERGLGLVMTAAQRLHDEGFGPTIEIAGKLEQVLVTGRTRGLAEYNIALGHVKAGAEGTAAAIEALKRVNEEEVYVDPGLKAIERLSAATRDWVTGFKHDIGEVFKWFAETVMGWADRLNDQRSNQATASAVNQHTVTPQQAAAITFRRIYGHGFNPGDTERFDIGNLQQEAFVFDSLNRSYATQQSQEDVSRVTTEANRAAFAAILQGGMIKLQQSGGYVRKSPGYSSGAKEYGYLDQLKFDLGYNSKWELGPSELQRGLNDNDQWQLRTTEASEGPSQFSDMFTQGLKTLEEYSAQRKEFDAQMKDRTSLLGGSFDLMSQGLSAAVEAAITGSDSIGRAFMKASAQALKAIALEAGAKALFATAEGLFFDNPEALAAAGFYTAAALAAGAGAAILGSLGGGSGGSSSAGSPHTAAGGGLVANSNAGPRQVAPIIIQIGDGFVGKPDELGKAIADQLNAAQKTGRASVTVTSQDVVRYKAG